MTWKWKTEKVNNSLTVSGSMRAEDGYTELLDERDTSVVDTFTFNLTQYFADGIRADSVVHPGDTLFVRLSNFTQKRIWGNNDKRYHLSLNNDLSFFTRENDQLNFGISIKNAWYTIHHQNAYNATATLMYFPDKQTPIPVPDSVWLTQPYAVDSTMDVQHAGAYAEYVFQQGPWKAVGGVRGDYYTVITDAGISPRLGVSVDIPTLGLLSLGGGLYYQFPSDFSGLVGRLIAANPNGERLNAPLDDVKLQRCWQLSAGFERQIGSSHVVTAETYYKWYDREYPFRLPGERRYFDYSGNTITWNLDNPDGKKRAYGVELSFLKKNYEHFFYSLGYSLFAVENKYTNGTWYNDENNVRNALGLSVGLNFLKHHGLAFRLSASEGKPYSAIRYDEEFDAYYLDSDKPFYNQRLDPLFSLSTRYTFNVYKGRYSVTGYCEIWNVLNMTPVVERVFDPYQGYRDFRANTILPVGGVTVDF